LDFQWNIIHYHDIRNHEHTKRTGNGTELIGHAILSVNMQSFAWKEEDTAKGIRKSERSQNLNLISGCAHCRYTFIIDVMYEAYIIFYN
jgi:hypothetical protein